jgi:capsid protein
VAADEGEDLEEIFQTLKAETELAAKYGITLTAGPPGAQPPTNNTQNQPTDATDQAGA